MPLSHWCVLDMCIRAKAGLSVYQSSLFSRILFWCRILITVGGNTFLNKTILILIIYHPTLTLLLHIDKIDFSIFALTSCVHDDTQTFLSITLYCTLSPPLMSCSPISPSLSPYLSSWFCSRSLSPSLSLTVLFSMPISQFLFTLVRDKHILVCQLQDSPPFISPIVC